ncbi:SDR family NAD(P)-dependent oxidoreductase [Geomicrobium sp. JCM 19038]|uniref:SDR family NAD(P)-dependent oxidoreductase n=1 Tax=Geomicrobium sp. JCM 19038 TaxID=1460635 RepID=UPI00045F2551|nr:SDR family NAD(P)-dependent oxidoreductase [Geomicrobium sp. JCM 19038]GAK08193.1 3-oxoacyl-[acyl-carrier protein] reductase [Geomicrobium sp. JCM 19038]
MINPNLKGIVILITGGNSGIGSAITEQFAEMGSKIIIHYYDKEEKATQLVRTIQESGGEAVAIYADLRQEQDIDQLMEKSIKAFGTVDALINNVAACVLDTIFDTTGETIDEHFEMNARVPVQLMNRFVLLHKEQGKKEGSIVNISTDASQKLRGKFLMEQVKQH